MEKFYSVEKFAQRLDLDILNHGEKDEIKLTETEICRPGLQFSGFFNYFEYHRVQVVGLVEYMYLEEKGAEYREQVLEKYFSYSIPCIIVTRDLKPHKEFMDAAERHGVPVFESKADTTEMKQKLLYFLCALLAPSVERHGVLMDIYGLGVMIIGESGIGKSETALELVKRKHRLVADDVVEIKKLSPNRLVGIAPQAIRYLLEIRGIGIIDVSEMYGVVSVLDKKGIDLVIELERWDNAKRYERIGMSEESQIEILDVKLPHMLVPVRSGRNLAIVIEAAARYYIGRKRGIDPIKQLEARLEALSEEALI
ncbi:MAG: HPr(Ser) kinase/phosphatase [Clostridia bacterium]|nr:HPr(Ser) kinase/phosphatase [Clostridia bacterium]